MTRPPVELVRGGSVFLDFDGTLVDLAETPDAVIVSDRLRALLSAVHDRLGGRVAIITGRAGAAVSAMIDPAPVSVTGSHGLEAAAAEGQLDGSRAELQAVAAELRKLEREHPGLIVEEKPLGVALHFRQVPSAEALCRSAIERAAQGGTLIVQPGKMMFELRPAGPDKGDALTQMMAQPPFSGTRPVVFGDDLTDERAFIAARMLGGAGVLVGELRETAASYHLPSVTHVLDWLAQAVEAES